MQTDSFDGPSDAAMFQVVKAVREAIPALIALWGFSDSGKTYSALRLARGLVGPKGVIVVIDTENKRAKYYAGMFGGFLHIDLQPPFTPERYTAAYEAAIRAGANAIIVDSESHVWEGEGGVLEQADATKKEGLLKWKAPKTAYNRMFQRQLRSPVHVIFCLRAKDKYVQKGHGKGAEIEFRGPEPVCGKRFIYEMMIGVEMESGTRKPLKIKAPEPIATVIKPGEFISEESGAAIAAWLAGGVFVDHEIEALKTAARGVAIEGSVKIRDWWESITKPQRVALKSILPELHQLAKEADAAMARAAAEENAGSDKDPLADEFTVSDPAKSAA